MKFISFLTKQGEERLGLYINEKIIDISTSAEKISLKLPSRISEFLEGNAKNREMAKKVEEAFLKGKLKETETNIRLLSPIPHPPSCRDAYAFRQHVEAARKNRGLEMVPEFDQFPIFYYTNHHAIMGEGPIVVEKDHLEQLDFELEVAIVIGKKGKNIPAQHAEDHIAGFTIMNDFSARLLQMEEMKLSLGPAKGKDFATTLGPWLVTPDELESKKIKTPFGSKYNLYMKAYHNGKLVSSGNLKDMNWTFAEIIERAAYGTELFPGDVIGSGTVGTGCYLELNGTYAREAKEKGTTYIPVWLKEGDTIELEVESLGKLKNTIVKSRTDYSILEKKKMIYA